MKVLVIQQKMIGDVLTSTILCEQIKKHFPDSEVHYLINTHTAAVVLYNPFIDEVVFFTDAYRNSKRAFYSFLQGIAAKNYDVVIDAYGKPESILISLFSGAKIKSSYVKWYSRGVYTHTYKNCKIGETPMGLAIENRLQLLKPIIPNVSGGINPPKIYLSATEIEEASSFLKRHDIDFSKPLVMINVLGSSKNKTYPFPLMAHIIDTIARQGDVTLLFNYIPPQENDALEIYALCTKETRAKIILAVFAPSLRSFLGVLYHCTALIGNEGGAVNMAKALQIPTFSIFSPWITKRAWELFADNPANAAVHLNDYRPNLFLGKSRKQLKKEADSLYTIFEPSLYKKKLHDFLAAKVFMQQ
jgi:heptosyltransferase-2